MTIGILRKIHDDDCPYVKRKSAGDESWDFCEINDKPCLRESGLECDIYNEWLKEKDNG